MKSLAIFVISLFINVFSTAQNPGKNIFERLKEPGQGQITIVQDERIEKLVLKHIRRNELKKGIDGFRVQIFT
jgi:hypothetical protein